MNTSTNETDIEALRRACSTPRTRVPVTNSALMQRLRRYHSGRGERFCITRGAENNQSTLRDLGYWHVCDGRHVLFALYSHEALIAHARDVGVLAAREEVSL